MAGGGGDGGEYVYAGHNGSRNDGSRKDDSHLTGRHRSVS